MSLKHGEGNDYVVTVLPVNSLIHNGYRCRVNIDRVRDKLFEFQHIKA